LKIGHFFRVQDDFLDCFGDPKVTGKAGTDIARGKISWLLVVALQRANREQKEVLQSHYGRDEADSVQRVKDVYQQLKLPKVFRAYEEQSYADIVNAITQIPGEGKILPPKLFTFYLDRVYLARAKE